MSETVTVTLAGRDIEFRPPTDAQFFVVHRIMARTKEKFEEAGDDGLTRQSIAEVAKILDVLDYMVVSDADKKFLERSILDGKVDFPVMLEAFGKASAGTDTGDKPVKRAPAKKATRGRARRAD